MATFFETAILQLQEIGFFKFLLPFILTAAVVYGGLRRSQLFGDPDRNVAVNAVVAFVISLFVWAAPILLGFDIERGLSAFFIQGFSVALVVLVGLILAGMFFPPDLAKNLSDKMKAEWFWGALIIISVIIGVLLLISSGLWAVLFPGGTSFKIPSELILSAVAIIALAAIVVLVVKVAK